MRGEKEGSAYTLSGCWDHFVPRLPVFFHKNQAKEGNSFFDPRLSFSFILEKKGKIGAVC